jgi:hypothetical protein
MSAKNVNKINKIEKLYEKTSMGINLKLNETNNKIFSMQSLNDRKRKFETTPEEKKHSCNKQKKVRQM